MTFTRMAAFVAFAATASTLAAGCNVSASLPNAQVCAAGSGTAACPQGGSTTSSAPTTSTPAQQIDVNITNTNTAQSAAAAAAAAAASSQQINRPAPQPTQVDPNPPQPPAPQPTQVDPNPPQPKHDDPVVTIAPQPTVTICTELAGDWKSLTPGDDKYTVKISSTGGYGYHAAHSDGYQNELTLTDDTHMTNKDQSGLPRVGQVSADGTIIKFYDMAGSSTVIATWQRIGNLDLSGDWKSVTPGDDKYTINIVHTPDGSYHAVHSDGYGNILTFTDKFRMTDKDQSSLPRVGEISVDGTTLRFYDNATSTTPIAIWVRPGTSAPKNCR